MNEKEANIDLLFRNGLKDFEVLPPPAICNNILAAVKVKSRPYILLKIAAAITVLVALSFFTYRWSRQVSFEPSTPVISFDVPVSPPVLYNPAANEEDLQKGKINNVENSSDVLKIIDNQAAIQQPIETSDSPYQIMNFKRSRSLTLASNEITDGLFVTSPSQYGENTAKIKYQDLPYLPENIITKPEKRWSIAAMASPTYYSSFNSGNDEIAKQLSAAEQPLVSYSGGVAFSYKISKRFSIQSGLYYSSLGQRVDGISSFSGFQQYVYTKGGSNFAVLTTNGTVYTSNPDVYLSANGTNRVLTAYNNDEFDPKKASLQPVNNSLDQNFSYLELPVILRYKILDKTIGINLIGGLSYNLLVNNSVYTTTIDGTRYSIGKTEGLNPLALSSSLGMGMEYNLSGKLSLNLEPTFRYYLNPFSVTTGSFIHPYSFGIFSGVSYKF